MSSRWLWINRPYTGKETEPVILNPLQPANGHQWVFWQVWDTMTNTWGRSTHPELLSSSGASERLFKTVTDAVRAFAWCVGGCYYRLVRADGTPLLTAWRTLDGWGLAAWHN